MNKIFSISQILTSEDNYNSYQDELINSIGRDESEDPDKLKGVEKPNDEQEYQFPEISKLQNYIDTFKNKDPALLYERMAEIGIVAHKIQSSNKKKYSEIRIKYCAINLVLNELGLAPSFRSIRRLTKHENLDEEQILLSRDRQVIDLHYLYCQHKDENIIGSIEYSSLFDGEFDFQLASEISRLPMLAKNKAQKLLKLPLAIQYKLAILSSKRAKDRLRRIKQSAIDVELSLRDLTKRPGSKITTDDIRPRLEYFICLKLAEKGSPSDAVNYLNAISLINIPNDPRELANLRELVRKRRVWFEKRLDQRFR